MLPPITMAISVVMPALEMAQETGKLVAWLKKEGDTIARGEPLLEVETDKAVLEVEALADGVLAGINADQGAVVPVGQVIAWILSPGEAVPSKTMTVEPAMEPVTETTRLPDQMRESPGTASQRTSPKARRLAQEHGIDLGLIRGSGPDAEILASDVQALIDAKHSRAANAGTEPSAKPMVKELSATARLMAERTTLSWTTVPHFFLNREVDATALNAARATWGPEIEQRDGVKLTYTDLLIALVARTLLKHPLLNASWIDSHVQLNGEIRVAIAMAVKDGVVAAVVPNAATAGLGEIAAHRGDLTERARTGRLRPADVSNATFTISNLGMYEIDSFNAIITPPQAAILAVGRIADRVVPVGGGIGVRPMLSLTLSSDHRVLDGAKAAMFMHDLAGALQDPGSCLG
jgi:pyruvate dehydrogenase E2 component (dihydrolipoyllysine-residue acetyltransferase)